MGSVRAANGGTVNDAVTTPAPVAELYRQMLRIRLVEERIADLYSDQEMRCPVHLCIGQEATAVGVCAALRREDYVFGTHRSHGHYLAKGGDLPAMLAELYGKATGCCGGKGGSMHLLDRPAGFFGSAPIVGSTLPIAVGASLGAVMRGEDRVVVAFFGEGATEEGVFHEAINFAAVRQLPVIFACENNLYSVYSPMEVRQSPRRNICAIAEANGVAARRGDGNHVQAVVELASEAVLRARSGEGPTLLELQTYRWREHCGPLYDNDLDYRPEGEYERWRARCPLEQAKNRLTTDGALGADEVADLETEIRAEIDDAVQFAKESPFPRPEALYEDVYGS